MIKHIADLFIKRKSVSLIQTLRTSTGQILFKRPNVGGPGIQQASVVQQAAQPPKKKRRSWVRTTVFFGLLYGGYLYVRRRRDENAVAATWEVACYRLLPLKTISRTWGWINSIDLPPWAREPVIGLYARKFGCKLEEAEIQDLTQYRNLGEFFRRPIKLSARPIDKSDCVVSPADGIVLACGPVLNSQLEQVKGVTYSLCKFLGPNCWTCNRRERQKECPDYQHSLLSRDTSHELYHCVIYLAPGDYHRFHSPVDWEVTMRRHFTGDLMSVNPRVAKWIAGLFELNERAVYVGKWKHGFFSMTLVGATNVGSIRVNMDQDLQTNLRSKRKGIRHDFSFLDPKGRGVRIPKGDLFGEFNLGSTIVLVFEAPRGFAFGFREGERVQFGQSLHCSANKRLLSCGQTAAA